MSSQQCKVMVVLLQCSWRACFPLVQVKRVYSGLLDTREERWAQVWQNV